MTSLNLISVGAAVMLLSACGGGEVANLKNLELSKGGYDATLASEYKDFALYEANEMGDRRSADRFATKAMAAARGERPAPEELRRWNPPEETRDELMAARKRLLSSLNNTSPDHWPDATAKALSRFDCWVEQLDENFQPAHITACRNGFYQAMFDTENPLPTAFIAFFDLDKAVPRGDGADAAAGAIRKAISGETPATVGSIGEVHVLVGGYADRSGSRTYNYRLSLKRAQNVRDKLIGLGVPAGRIAIRAHGESQPLVETPDGIAELRNRRVEIRIDLVNRI